ncbi:unnamed protein product [Effrenium voratum]|nr:unnamed protein product [Effrenium voratum]
MPQYAVCLGLPNGALVVRQSIIDLWTNKHEDYKSATLAVIARHDAEFSKESLKRGYDETGDDAAANQPAAKKLCVQERTTVENLTNAHTSRITLACGQFSLSWAPDAQALHAFSDKQVTVASLTELFGFGSGDFVQSGEADDVMSDVRGKRWEFNLTNPDCLAILEPDRKLPDHLRGDVTYMYFPCQFLRFLSSTFCNCKTTLSCDLI